ncbi:skin secretory protein xP2-like [Zingiber officinale]|uniref:skin secretory protein xP2-like n=1 Tax=Zingiber officinale TaxID=94328 RepID=UPI001C4BABAB|nr:skin secretory protein xP2-like [Zingiber officinale]
MVEKASCYIKVEEAQAARQKAEKTMASGNRPERRAPQPPQPFQRIQPRPAPQPAPGARPAPRVAAIQAPRPGPRGAPYCTRAAEQGLPPPALAPQIQRMEEEWAAAGRARQALPDLAGHLAKLAPAKTEEKPENLIIGAT